MTLIYGSFSAKDHVVKLGDRVSCDILINAQTWNTLMDVVEAAKAPPIREHWSDELCTIVESDELQNAIDNLNKALLELEKE